MIRNEQYVYGNKADRYGEYSFWLNNGGLEELYDDN